MRLRGAPAATGHLVTYATLEMQATKKSDGGFFCLCRLPASSCEVAAGPRNFSAHGKLVTAAASRGRLITLLLNMHYILGLHAAEVAGGGQPSAQLLPRSGSGTLLL